MAVQARNTATDLSFAALQAVHRPGRSQLQNIRASEYFRDGGIVSSMATNGQIAQSGQQNWQLSQFVGSRGSAWQYRETLTRAAGWGITSIRGGYEYTNTDSTWVFDTIDRGNTSTNWFMKVSPDAGTTCSTYSIGGGEVRIGGEQFQDANNTIFLAQTGQTTDLNYEPNWGRPYTGAYFTNTSVITLLNRYVIYRAGLPTIRTWIQDVILTFPLTGAKGIVRAYRWNNVNYFLIAGDATTVSGQTRIWWKPADNFALGFWNSFELFTGLSSGSFKFTVQAEWAVLHGTNGFVVASSRAQGGNEFWYDITAARTAMGAFFINTVAFNSVTNIWIMAGQGGRMVRGVGANLQTASWTEVGASLRDNPQWQNAAFNGSYIDTVIAWGAGFICHGTYPGASAWSPDGITWYFGTGAEGQTVRSTISSKNFEATFYDSVSDRLYFFYKGGYYIRTDGRDLAFTANSGTTLTRPYPANAIGGTGSAPPAIGSAYQGGYYVGRIVVDGLIYRLIVSPKSDESQRRMRPGFFAMPPGAISLIDGWANSQVMMSASANPDNDFNAVHWCRTRTTGGYSDWYLPSRDEMELIYRTLKPSFDQNYTTNDIVSPIGSIMPDGLTWGQNLNSLPRGAQYSTFVPGQTNLAIFQAGAGGTQALEPNTYWTSSRTITQEAYAWYFDCAYGSINWGAYPNTNLYVRPVRRVLDA